MRYVWSVQDLGSLREILCVHVGCWSDYGHEATLVRRVYFGPIAFFIIEDIVVFDGSFLSRVLLPPLNHHLLAMVLLLVNYDSVSLLDDIVFGVAEKSARVDELLSIVCSHHFFNLG